MRRYLHLRRWVRLFEHVKRRGYRLISKMIVLVLIFSFIKIRNWILFPHGYTSQKEIKFIFIIWTQISFIFWNYSTKKNITSYPRISYTTQVRISSSFLLTHLLHSYWRCMMKHMVRKRFVLGEKLKNSDILGNSNYRIII